MSQYDEDANSVHPKHRFMTDPTAHKMVGSLAGMYHNSQRDTDDDEEYEIPEVSKNNRVLIIGGVYDLLDDILANSNSAVEGEDEETAAVRSVGREVAKDKRMSQFYKAFMAKMRDMVGPYHEDKVKFANMWVNLGNELLAKSEGKEFHHPHKMAVIKDENGEEAAVVGSQAALPTKLANSITEMGFKPIPPEEKGDAAWCMSGANDGYPGDQVILVRRADNSWMVAWSKLNKYGHYGKIMKHRILGEESSPDAIMRVIAYMYDQIGDDST